MTYILVFWSIVGYGGTNMGFGKEYDWRPIGEFHHENETYQKKTAKEMCEEAARQLSIPKEKYRCIKSK